MRGECLLDRENIPSNLSNDGIPGSNWTRAVIQSLLPWFLFLNNFLKRLNKDSLTSYPKPIRKQRALPHLLASFATNEMARQRLQMAIRENEKNGAQKQDVNKFLSDFISKSTLYFFQRIAQVR